MVWTIPSVLNEISKIRFINRWVHWCKLVISVSGLRYLRSPNNVSITLFKGGIVTPTATLISRIKFFEMQLEIDTIPSVLNEISKIQIGMHTPMLNEIFKGKISSSLFNEISNIFESRIEIGTIPSLLNEISKIQIGMQNPC